jgi:hypothetical protein
MEIDEFTEKPEKVLSYILNKTLDQILKFSKSDWIL